MSRANGTMITFSFDNPNRDANARASPYSKPPVGRAGVPAQKPGSGI